MIDFDPIPFPPILDELERAHRELLRSLILPASMVLDQVGSSYALARIHEETRRRFLGGGW